jgi:hypothetical protein
LESGILSEYPSTEEKREMKWSIGELLVPEISPIALLQV